MYKDPVILDGEVHNESPKYMTDLWTERGIDFIEKNKDGEEPFFLYLAYNGPYCLSRLLLRPAKNRWAEYYSDKYLPSFPRDSAHPWQYSNLDYHNNIVSIRRVAAEVSGVDDGVGAIFETLRKHDLDENTLVIFAGDQGWMGGQNGFFGMGDHTKPMAAHDMMMHVPFLFWQPGKVAAGKSEAMVTNYDFLPSVLDFVGLKDRTPTEPKLPGRSFAPILRGVEIPWETEMYYEMESCRSVRTEKWKYVERRSPDGPGELYDMEIDPMERFNLFNQEQHVEIQAAMAKKLYEFFDSYADPEYDVWNGGRSKARRHHAPKDHPDYREPKPRPWKAEVEKVRE
jgi:arylsulfatase A-like enzyme